MSSLAQKHSPAEQVNSTDLKRILLLGLFLFIIPIIGWLTSLYAEASLDHTLHQVLVSKGYLSEAEYGAHGISSLSACLPGGVLAAAVVSSDICSEASEVHTSRLVAAATAGLGAFLIAFIFAGEGIVKQDRKRLSQVFAPLVRLVMLLLAVSVVAQAGLLVYSIYTFNSLPLYHLLLFKLIFVIVLSAIVGCFHLLKSSLKLLSLPASEMHAELLSRAAYPEIYELVEQTATKLGAQIPDQIVVGLEPNFFVTTNPVQLLGTTGQALKGRTLFMSLALLHILNQDELTAVIGHELGHFRGQDTEYSLKFAPIYSRLTTALHELSTGHSAKGWAILPAIAVLNFCLNRFASIERSIGRERELLADKAGAEATSATALAHALLKTSLYADYWYTLTSHHIKVLGEGKAYDNLVTVYATMCSDIYASLDWSAVKLNFLTYVQPHPVDKHPPLSMRLEALGVSLNDDAAVLAPASQPASTLIPNSVNLEERLTWVEVHRLQAIGAVVIPQLQTSA